MVADTDDRLADRRLVARVEVDLGGVEPVHAGIQGGRDDLADTLDREVGAVSELVPTEADRRHLNTRRSQRSQPHLLPLPSAD